MGPLSNEQANPPTDIDWLSDLQTLLSDARVALVQEATERAAHEDTQASDAVKRWRAQRLGRRMASPVRYALPRPLLINGRE